MEEISSTEEFEEPEEVPMVQRTTRNVLQLRGEEPWASGDKGDQARFKEEVSATSDIEVIESD